MKKVLSFIVCLILTISLVGCSGFQKKESNETQSYIDSMYDVRGWLVSDIWNKGFCDLSFYYASGKSSTGESMDVEFTLKNLKRSYDKKSTYDEIINSLPSEYEDIKYTYSKISEQIDILYSDVMNRGAQVTGNPLETSLYNQYFETFDDLLSEADSEQAK